LKQEFRIRNGKKEKKKEKVSGWFNRFRLQLKKNLGLLAQEEDLDFEDPNNWFFCWKHILPREEMEKFPEDHHEELQNFVVQVRKRRKEERRERGKEGKLNRPELPTI